MSLPPWELQNQITRFNYTNYSVVLPTFVPNFLSFEKTEDKKTFSTHTGFKASTVMVVGSTVLWDITRFNPLNAELNPICYLLALLGAHRFLHVSRIRVKSLILRLLM